jgi:hypothetical protein
MTMQEQYESKTGERALYRKDGADYHTLRYVRWLEFRLAEEIKWGHRDCQPDNCMSSGTDCPANSVLSSTKEGEE